MKKVSHIRRLTQKQEEREFERIVKERFGGSVRGRVDRVFERERYSGSYGTWVGRVGELILAKAFFHPSRAQTVIIDDYIIAKNLPREAWPNCADVILYDRRTNFIDGLMEVKTTARPARAFRIAQRVGGYSWFRAASYAMAEDIPVWLGVLRLKRPFPYRSTKSGGREVVGLPPHRFVGEADLATYVGAIDVYGEGTFEMDEHAIPDDSQCGAYLSHRRLSDYAATTEREKGDLTNG